MVNQILESAAPLQNSDQPRHITRPRRTSHTLTQTEVDKLFELHDAGVHAVVIAESLGVTKGAIEARIRTASRKNKKGKMHNEKVKQKLLKLRAKGLTYKDISGIVGISESYVGVLLRGSRDE